MHSLYAIFMELINDKTQLENIRLKLDELIKTQMRTKLQINIKQINEKKETEEIIKMKQKKKTISTQSTKA